ncbi:hypothetical protein EDD38_2059 [Kitasatospora cineracea]|uniref:Peptidase YpeB-like protein n=2 Tax=Kitasatospora cineracea TaxID=88074 RepID=A0A3N4RS71_9ACTN|nr:hypothetical protein EDD38_2059 [Kitasatospora cineracea]
MLGARPDGNRSGRVPRRGSTRMSESQSQSPQSPQSQPQPQPQPAEPGTESIDLTKLPAPEPSSAAAGPAPAPGASRRSLRLPGRRGVRWVLGAAVVVVLGVAAVGTGVALERHHERGVPVFDRAYVGRGPLAAPGVPKAPGVPGKVVVRGADGSVQVFPGAGAEQLPEGVAGLPGFQGSRGFQGVQDGDGPAQGLAPAALPAVPADQAVAKAAAAVPNGKVDALAVVGREGGGSSWSVEVLGPDGVRHLVTVDGTDGSVTGNTVAAGR